MIAQRRFKGFCAAFATLLLAASICTGCPRPEEDFALEMELIVADAGLGSTSKVEEGSPFNYPRILIYQDVLQGNAQQEPDLVLSGEAIPELQHPVHMLALPYSLYVCDDVYGAVLVWNSLPSLVWGHDTDTSPDVVLDGLGAVGEPVFAIEDYWEAAQKEYEALIIADLSSGAPKDTGGCVHIFRNPSKLTSDRAPNVTLTEPEAPVALVTANKQLIVADAGMDRVLVYTNLMEILEMEKDAVPEIVELSGASWLGLDEHGSVTPTMVAVSENRLFVTTASNMLFVFSPADALQNHQAPDAVIAGANGGMNVPIAMARIGGRLFVGNANAPFAWDAEKDEASKANTIGVVAFDNLAGLASGQAPSLVLDSSNAQVPTVRGMFSYGNALVCATRVAQGLEPIKGTSEAELELGDIHIFRHADKMIQGRSADLVLPALKDFAAPLSVEGTFFIEGAS
ncbi:MAG: hypothetical protein IT365_12840 [Candidatus Hydrogenedentes bacterium]|nr:hypothetical protein [Candidatus Hydrogenedentota bacterium]